MACLHVLLYVGQRCIYALQGNRLYSNKGVGVSRTTSRSTARTSYQSINKNKGNPLSAESTSISEVSSESVKRRPGRLLSRGKRLLDSEKQLQQSSTTSETLPTSKNVVTEKPYKSHHSRIGNVAPPSSSANTTDVKNRPFTLPPGIFRYVI
jgi:hypothetical protein